MTQFSNFGNRFNRPSGILQLMKDLGGANANSSSETCMLGGGNPAAIPEAETIYAETFSDLMTGN